MYGDQIHSIEGQGEVSGMLPVLPRKKNDELLKGAFEDNFADFLRFIYADIDELVDFSKPVEFMDKELFAIIPDRERNAGGREADLLAKLYLKNGTESWVLLNVEIENGKDLQFALRLLEYNYRIRDRYKVSVATIAIYTGDKNQLRPDSYRDELLATILSFKFNTYHIFDHTAEELLEQAGNPFALIVLACQNAVLEGKIPEKELAEKRLTIAKALLKHNYDKDRTIGFLTFLKNFLFVRNKEINRKFDQLVQEFTNGKIEMGIIETIKMQERRDGKLEGQEETKSAIVKNLLEQSGMPDEQIAGIAEVSLAFVQKVRQGLASG